MAILLSLCGVRVDVGLDSYLSPAWQDMILGPTSALTQTQFHNLRNRLDSQSTHPKNVDLDGFFTTRRLLGWIHSLDRLQVPQAELETWLVQREQDPLPGGFPEQRRAAAGVERDPVVPNDESRTVFGVLNEEDEEEEAKEDETQHLPPRGGPDHERGEEEEERTGIHSLYRSAEDGARTQIEVDQTSSSLQECMRLLEETFPFAAGQQQLQGAGDGNEGLENPIAPSRGSTVDLELQWQDLLAIMNSQETLQQNQDNHPAVADQQVLSLDTPTPHGLRGGPSHSAVEPELLPLTPSEALDNHSLTSKSREPMNPCNVNPLHSPPDHSDLLEEDPLQGFSLAEMNPNPFNLNLPPQDLGASMDDSPCPYPENLASFSANGQSLIAPSVPTSPSSDSLFDDDMEDEGGLPSPLNDLIEDSAILDEIRLLDLALEEGFSPEMAARLDEEGYLYRETSQRETGRDDGRSLSSMAVDAEDLDHTGTYHQDTENQADSDSGLSLGHSHSSPCPSESSYSSSSSSSSSCVSAEESFFSEDEDEDEDTLGPSSSPDMDVTVKQEPEEEELGAVGGWYAEDVKQPFHQSFGDDKLLNGLPWLEHVGHDHTYNQPWPSASEPSPGKAASQMPRSHLRRDGAAPHRHISEARMWNRDDRRARALKIPFSNEVIINLPVDDFNDLVTSSQLTEEQLVLIRDIRRRGKNKIAAQNCRKRKMDVLQGLRDDVSDLVRRRSRLLREKQENLRSLQEMKRQLRTLYQDVFSGMRDSDGRPLDPTEHVLQFEGDAVTVGSRNQGRSLTKPGKKQRDKKK